MLVNQYHDILKAIRTNKSITVINNTGTSKTLGSDYTYNDNMRADFASILSMLKRLKIYTANQSTTSYIVVGSSNAVEDGTSVKIDSVVGTISTSKGTFSSTENADGSVTGTQIHVITNTSSQSVTIGEIAMFGVLYDSKGSATPLLIDRTPLETPLTLAPNEVGQIMYSITVG